MSDTPAEFILPEDEPPKNGEWYEHTPLTEEEIAQGNRLGNTIDPENDEDSGL